MNGRIKMSEKSENLDGYERLAAAIVLCAAQDYREAYGNIYFYNGYNDFEKGKQYLIDKGYTGEVLSAMQPPGTVIPALVSRGEIYEGSKTIEEYFKEENHGDY